MKHHETAVSSDGGLFFPTGMPLSTVGQSVYLYALTILPYVELPNAARPADPTAPLPEGKDEKDYESKSQPVGDGDHSPSPHFIFFLSV